MQHGISLASLSNLRQQNQFYGSNFDNVAGQVIEKINAMQKDVNRELKPVVAAAMENAYQWCAAEMGKWQTFPCADTTAWISRLARVIQTSCSLGFCIIITLRVFSILLRLVDPSR